MTDTTIKELNDWELAVTLWSTPTSVLEFIVDEGVYPDDLLQSIRQELRRREKYAAGKRRFPVVT